MKILIYGINFKPELSGIGKYSGEMADWLAARGHDVVAVTAPPYYPEWKVGAGFRNWYAIEGAGNLKIYRCPLYVPRTPGTLSRLLHLISFAFSSLFVLIRLLAWRPAVIFVVEPTFFCAPMALLYARLTGAKTVLHVQDYEIDAMFGLGLARPGLVARLAYRVESWLMSRFDRISTISFSMMRLAEAKGIPARKISFFPNWVDTQTISPDADRHYFRKMWGVPEDAVVVLYAGNMGRKQGLEIVLEAASRLRETSNIMFFLVGDGAARAELEQIARSANLTNVRFESLRPLSELPQLLAFGDIHLVVQRIGAADVVLPSKLTGILSAGGWALITAENNTELGQLIERFPGIAVRVEPESATMLSDAIERMLDRDFRVKNHIARDYAEQYLDCQALLATFERDLTNMLAASD